MTQSRTPQGLEDVSKYPYLFAELMQDPTWTEEDLRKLAGLNFLRVFRQVEKVGRYFKNLIVLLTHILAGFLYESMKYGWIVYV